MAARTLQRSHSNCGPAWGVWACFPPPLVRPRLISHLVCTSGGRVCLVPTIPRSALLSVVWTPPEPTQHHPMSLYSPRSGGLDIKAFLKSSQYLRRILLSVYGDLHFRLAFRLLPVRSRFWFLAALTPGIQYCVREGCTAIETECHLFFTVT